MKRRQARKQAFIFIFESEFGSNSVQDIIEMAETYRGEEVDNFARDILVGIKDKEDIIEKHIENNLLGWKIGRISTVAKSILKMAIYEIMYMKEIPENISINEAVELAKIYGEKEEYKYINGVLGSFVRKLKEEK